MSIYLAMYKRNELAAFPSANAFDDFLPFPRSTLSSAECKNTRLYQWSWGAAFDLPIFENDSGALVVNGACSSKSAGYLAENLWKTECQLQPEMIPNHCGSVFIADDALYAYTSVSGAEVVYYVCTPDFIAASNRVGILSVFGDFPINPQSVIGLIGRTHLTDDGTILKDVMKLHNGSRLIAREQKMRIEKFDPSLLWYDSPLSTRDFLDEMDRIVEDFSFLRDTGRQIRFGLSGGKDSRALLGILDANDCVNEKMYCYTTGEYFSPEVLAAGNVAELFSSQGLKHAILCPGMASSVDVAKRIVESIYLNEASLSLADLAGASPSADIAISGQELHKAVATNFSFEDFMKQRKTLLNPAGYIKEPYIGELVANYGEMLHPYLENAPVESFSLLEKLFMRMCHWQAGVSMFMNMASTLLQPLINFNLAKSLLNAPAEVRNTQFAIFALMQKSGKPLASQPFCNDGWPPALFPLLKKLGIKYDPVMEHSVPYRFSELLPAAKRFGFSPVRNILFSIAKKILPEFIRAHPEYCNPLDSEKFLKDLALPNELVPLRSLYGILGLLAVAVAVENKDSFLKRSKRDELSEKIRQYVEPEKQNISIVAMQAEKIQNFGKSIAKLVSKNREYEILCQKYVEYEIAESGIDLANEGYSTLISLSDKRKMTISGRVFLNKDEKYTTLLFFLTQDGEHRPLPGLTWSEWKKFYYAYPIPPLGSTFDLSFVLPDDVKEVGVHFCYTGKKRCFLLGAPKITFE